MFREPALAAPSSCPGLHRLFSKWTQFSALTPASLLLAGVGGSGVRTKMGQPQGKLRVRSPRERYVCSPRLGPHLLFQEAEVKPPCFLFSHLLCLMAGSMFTGFPSLEKKAQLRQHPFGLSQVLSLRAWTSSHPSGAQRLWLHLKKLCALELL